MASIEEKVISIIAEQLGREPEKINAESDIINDLGADSIEIAEMLITFEDEFGIDIDESKAQNIVTVGDVIKQITDAVGET